MSVLEVSTLFFAMTVLAIVPSTSVALVVARSTTGGFPSGGAVAAGIVVGDLIFVLFAVLGVAALAEVMGSLFIILRYLAGAYLIWFGVSLMRSKMSWQMESSDRSALTLSASFFSGLFVTLGDVKAILFYASFFPAFVDLADVTILDVATIVALTIVAVGGVKLAYAYAAERIALRVQGFRAATALKVSAGGFMVGAGVHLLVKP